MYHFEFIWGESPDLATVNAAPSEPYDGEPCSVNESEGPLVKSMSTDRPSAEFGGQLPVGDKQLITRRIIYANYLPEVSGLQLVKVWPRTEVEETRIVSTAIDGLKVEKCIANKMKNDEEGGASRTIQVF